MTRDFLEQEKITLREFERLKDLHSQVLIEIPQRQIINPEDYRSWFEQMENEWMDINGNTWWRGKELFWNNDSRIYGDFNGNGCTAKYYRYDGTEPVLYDSGCVKRGVLIRAHYDRKRNVVNVHLIADSLVAFLKFKKIKHSRINFPKKETRILEE